MAEELFQDCIDACNRCAAECERCTSACLKEQMVDQLTRCIELNMDCSLLCVVTAKLLARDSEQAFPLAEQCADACRLCADECRTHDMAHCQRCADLCDRCAEECEKVAAKQAPAI